VEDPELLKGGEQKTKYRPRRTLSQMHIMNYMRFIGEKATYWKNFEAIRGRVALSLWICCSPNPFSIRQRIFNAAVFPTNLCEKGI